MKVLLTLHHTLNPNQGAPGVTLSLGSALEQAGCQVRYFGFGEAFPEGATDGVKDMIRFPWRVASFLARHAGEFDVVDASSGDSWVWARRGRPGALARHALVMRSHGLEHSLDRNVRLAHRAGQRHSWKYPLYHGGFRLWEVSQSMKSSDRCILLNDTDRDFVRETVGVPTERLAVVPNGIAEVFHTTPPPVAGGDHILRLAFVGSWLEGKGIGTLREAVDRLAATDLAFEISLLGTDGEPESILSSFSPAARPRIRVVPRYHNQDLPGLLSGRDILLFPSRGEGFGLALVEAMACGLAPVSTPVGVAPKVITPGENGVIIPPDNADALVRAVLEMAGDRNALLRMRVKAREAVSIYRWKHTAMQTIAVYEQALAGKPIQNVL